MKNLGTEIISAALAALSVLVPVALSVLERKSKLRKSVDFIALINARDELRKLSRKHNEDDGDVLLSGKLNSFIRELENEINKDDKRLDLRSFFIFTAFECALLFGFIYSNFWQFMSFYLSGETTRIGADFLEGIFKYPAARIGLLLFCIALSCITTVYFARRFGGPIYVKINRLTFNMLAWLMFNIIFIIFALTGGLILMITDPISPIW